MVTTGPIRLSVVVASDGPTRGWGPVLESIARACRALSYEVLVVTTPDVPGPHDPGVTHVVAERGAEVPHQWARGIAAASGEVVALTTAHFQVADTWATALLGAIEDGAAGASGPIVLAPGTGAVGRAVYYLRYASYAQPPEGRGAREIPGDNAAYPRRLLVRHSGLFGDGFWEVEFHRVLRAEGGELAFAVGARVETGDSFTFGAFLRQRFVHGRRSGGYRRSVIGISRWRTLIATPLLPFVLTARVLRKTAPARGHVLGALPALFSMTCAWALGELVGAWSGGRAA